MLGKFYTVKNWYKFLTARELVPIRYIFRSNIAQFVKNMHEVKFHIAYMRIPHIDKVPLKSAAFCIRFQIFTVLSLTSVTIQYQFFMCDNFLVPIVFARVRIGTSSSHVYVLIPIFHM